MGIYHNNLLPLLLLILYSNCRYMIRVTAFALFMTITIL
jgi:hypothetical protein